MPRPKRFVDPSVYTKEYYLTDCTGYSEFKKSYGEDLEPRFKELTMHFSVKPNAKVLDIGCGRGELVLHAAKQGATAIGIDYSKEAIKLANKMKDMKSVEIREKMKFFVMNAKKLTFPNKAFDIVFLVDVVEHLYNDELYIVFEEAKRVLKNDGIIFIHTAPNKFFFDIAYKFYSYPVSSVIVNTWNIFTGSSYPNIEKVENLRTDSHFLMHINEHTYFSLKKIFKKCNLDGPIFTTNITSRKPICSIKDILFNLLVYLHPLSKYFPLNTFFGSDFVAIVKKKK